MVSSTDEEGLSQRAGEYPDSSTLVANSLASADEDVEEAEDFAERAQ